MFDFIKSLIYSPASTNETPMERKALILTPVDEFSVSFIEIGNWNDKRDSHLSYAIPAIKSCVKNIQNKLDAFKKSPAKRLVQADKILSEEQRNNAIIVNLYNKTLDKSETYQIKIYEEALFYCEQMVNFIQNVIDHNYPIKVDYNNFIKKINEFIGKPSKITKYNLLIKFLYKKTSNPPNPSAPTIKTVRQELKNAIPLYNETTQYIQENDFDEVFEKFISSNETIMKTYSEILNSMSLFEYTKALDDLYALTKDISKSLGIPEKTDENVEFWIVFYTSTRYFFNQVTIQLPYLLSNNLSAHNFIKNCDKIHFKTPKELRASPKIFLPSQYETPVREVFENNEKLQKAVNYLRLIQFFNCPLDIASLADSAISLFNQIININLYLNKYCDGNPDANIPEEVLKSDSMIAFDDLFTFFYMGLSIYPPANATALNVFLQAFGHFTQSQSIEYASTTLQAAVRFICDLPSPQPQE
ncbi:hypothetical protein TRFO_32479 [Tritrichomonas foetus]|uniref:Uncharacterized protein n=1 Tax=Tritrichomonas foetus TaxID=1144522 RepID=A0A1J4JPR5_9EUKA|nr:hypothetical protein TRFO_32479 [Tritrichomonas foetus]|eukprot:OHT00746.1 hypothetical protein TRFO_32479 [Tritrichomonas foetus]